MFFFFVKRSKYCCEIEAAETGEEVKLSKY